MTMSEAQRTYRWQEYKTNIGFKSIKEESAWISVNTMSYQKIFLDQGFPLTSQKLKTTDSFIDYLGGCAQKKRLMQD